MEPLGYHTLFMTHTNESRMINYKIEINFWNMHFRFHCIIKTILYSPYTITSDVSYMVMFPNSFDVSNIQNLFPI